MTAETSAWAAIGIVALVTLASRLAGPALMAVIRTGPAVERFLDGLGRSVVVALVASMVAQGALREGAAAAAAALTMAGTRSATGAMLVGMAVAALWTAAEGA